MPRFAQLVIGPAGSGKSSYVGAIVAHGDAIKRKIHAVNLDPAAEEFNYDMLADIRTLVHLDDVQDDDETPFGPNGGLVFAFEYLAENLDWLKEHIGEEVDDDYIVFDCPGQIELTTHLDMMKSLIRFLQAMDFRVCVVFCLDCQFIADVSKFFAGVLVSLASMVNLELPCVNLITKTDLLNDQEKKRLEEFLEPDSSLIRDEITAGAGGAFNKKFGQLTEAIAGLIDDYSLVKFLPVNIFDEDNLGEVLMAIDNSIQFGEDEEVRVLDLDDSEPPILGGNGMSKDQ